MPEHTHVCSPACPYFVKNLPSVRHPPLVSRDQSSLKLGDRSSLQIGDVSSSKVEKKSSVIGVKSTVQIGDKCSSIVRNSLSRLKRLEKGLEERNPWMPLQVIRSSAMITNQRIESIRKTAPPNGLKKVERELQERNCTLPMEIIAASAMVTTQRLEDINPKASTKKSFPGRAKRWTDKPRTKPRRKELPTKPKGGASLWSVVRNSIGKDLSAVTLPVGFSEPLSMLQRLAEDFEYSALLDQAYKITDPLEQLAYIAAFTITAYASSGRRLNKPFNSLYGETYELDRRDDLGWKLISEQVKRTPPTSAQYCVSKHWKCWKSFSVASTFRGKYVKVVPSGTSHLVLDTGQMYSWDRIGSTVNNVMMGKMWLDNVGEMQVIDHTNKNRCILTYLPYHSVNKDQQKRVKGVIKDRDGIVRWRLDSKWDSFVKITPVQMTDHERFIDIGPSSLVWQAPEIPEEVSIYYNFSLFTCQLNEPEDFVAPTDSRNRLDIRLMEQGRWEEADIIKKKLEQRDREMKKDEEMARGAVWFRPDRDPVSREIIFRFTDRYWRAKAEGDWSMCPNIFTLTTTNNQ